MDSNNLSCNLGLSKIEVEKLKNLGLINKTPDTQGRSVWQIILNNLFSLFNLIILGICLFILGFYIHTLDQRLLLDSIGMLAVAIFNTLIAIIQELRAKLALDKVNLLLKRKISVIRDGEIVEVEYDEIVLGDSILISRGDQAIVDGTILKAEGLEMDESLLSGESVPIIKNAGDEILSGSFCIQGKGIYKAEKIGLECFAQQITKLARKHKSFLTPLQRRINSLIKILFVIAIFIVGLETISYFINPYFKLSEVDFARKIATILISLVPQGLVLFSSFTFALGVYKISRIGAIIQRLNAIESFANVNLICTDKTGTLTENNLQLRSITLINQDFPEKEVKTWLGSFSRLAVDKNATLRTLSNLPELKNVQKLNEIPFNSSLKYSALALNIDNKILNFFLGAPEILLEFAKSEEKNKAFNLFKLKKLGIFRTLVFGLVENLKMPNSLSLDSAGCFKPICFISISDTVRSDAYKALNEFKQKGIELKILSGDSTEAVLSILADLKQNVEPTEVISGNQLENLTDENFICSLNEKKVFARLKPEHKLKIISTLRRQGRYVAMLGDGVNDLPALKEANLGIAMEEGSSATKEVAEIVLLKNKFSLLPKIFAEGNRIINTVAAVAKLFLTKNFFVILFSLSTLFFKINFPLTPRRVSFINLLAIGIPSLILALFNRNQQRIQKFMFEVLSYVIIVAPFIIFSSQLAVPILNFFLPLSSLEKEMFILVNILLLCCFNFYLIAFYSDRPRLIYLIGGIILLGIVISLSLYKGNLKLLAFFQFFYEITPLTLTQFSALLVYASSNAFLLWFLLKLRSLIINKLNHS